MAEVVGLIAGISSILKAIGSASSVINGISQASHEATQVASQLAATTAVLTSLKLNFTVIHRSKEFLDIWSSPTRLVLDNIKTTTELLNTRLGSHKNQQSRLNLSFWKKCTWPFEREETLRLQLQLQGYMQMLSMIQNAFLQGTAQVAQEASQSIDDVFTSVGTYPFPISTVDSPALFPDQPTSSWSIDGSTVIPDDSISHLEDTKDRARRLLTSPVRRVTGSQLPEVALEIPTDKCPNLQDITSYTVSDLIIGEFWEKQTHLGDGTIQLACSTNHRRIWIVYKPLNLVHCESRWYLNNPYGRESMDSESPFAYKKRDHVKLYAHPDISKLRSLISSKKETIEFVISGPGSDPDGLRIKAFDSHYEELSHLLREEEWRSQEKRDLAKREADRQAAVMKSASRMTRR